MKTVEIFAVILLAAIFFVLGPFLVIWSLNTLFPALAIPYTFWTWLAALFLGGAMNTKMRFNK